MSEELSLKDIQEYLLRKRKEEREAICKISDDKKEIYRLQGEIDELKDIKTLKLRDLKDQISRQRDYIRSLEARIDNLKLRYGKVPEEFQEKLDTIPPEIEDIPQSDYEKYIVKLNNLKLRLQWAQEDME